MGRALEVVAGFVTNPGATLTTVTTSGGGTNIIRGTDTTQGTWLLSTWSFAATAGELRITSPRLHDQVQGIRNRVTAAFVGPLAPGHINGGFAQRLYAQDNLTIQQSGGGAEIDLAALLIGYDNLAGVAGRFIDQPTLQKSGVNILTAEVTVTAVTTGLWGGAVAINSSFDTLIANTDYAVVGGMTDTRGLAVGITAVDFGNLRCAFPAEPSLRNITQNWFQILSDAFAAYNSTAAAAYIPVFNSANKSSTLVDVTTNGAGGTYTINIELVQLAPNSVPAYASPTAAGQQPGQ
jgi:hypothetical protein